MHDLLRNVSRGLDTPALGPRVPQCAPGFWSWAGEMGLRLLRFRFEGSIPDVPRAVLAVAPHTSNWDFPVGLCTRLALRLDCGWLGKHTLFRGAFGAFLRKMGGIPVDRSSPRGSVQLVIEQFESRERIFLALAPEGTRRHVDQWKSGFHRIARAAGVPIVPVAMDWGRRRIRFLAPFTPTDDYERDVAALRALFSRDMARRPENF